MQDDTKLYSMPVEENTPLHLVILLPDQDKAIQLIRNTDEDTLRKWLMTKPLSNTALLLAMKTGAFRVAEELISLHQKYHLSLDHQDARGMTALHWAAFFRNRGLISMLLDYGANNRLEVNGGMRNGMMLACDVYTEDYKNRLNKLSHLLKTNQTIIKESSERNFTDITHEISDVAFHMDRICINLSLESSDRFLQLMPGQAFSAFIYFAKSYVFGLGKLEEYLTDLPCEQTIADRLRPMDYVKRLPSRIVNLHFQIVDNTKTKAENHVVLQDVDVNNDSPTQIRTRLERQCHKKFRLLIFSARNIEETIMGHETPPYEAAKDEDDPIHAVPEKPPPISNFDLSAIFINRYNQARRPCVYHTDPI